MAEPPTHDFVTHNFSIVQRQFGRTIHLITFAAVCECQRRLTQPLESLTQCERPQICNRRSPAAFGDGSRTKRLAGMSCTPRTHQCHGCKPLDQPHLLGSHLPVDASIARHRSHVEAHSIIYERDRHLPLPREPDQHLMVSPPFQIPAGVASALKEDGRRASCAPVSKPPTAPF